MSAAWPAHAAAWPLLDLLPWALLCLAAALLWWPRLRAACLAVLAAAVLAGFARGQLAPPALLAFALLGLAAWSVRPARPRAARIAGHVLFVAVAFALGLHLMPGFANLQWAQGLRLSAGAAPMSLYLNLDKPLAGFWLLLCVLGLRAAQPSGPQSDPGQTPSLPAAPARDATQATTPPTPWPPLAAGTLGALAAAAACLGLALALGVVAWAPKWPALGLLWALNNLLLVAMTEEAMFRGYLQGALQRLWRERRGGAWLATAVAAAAFGLVHAGGGPHWVALASVAGLAYGWAYRRGGLAAAVLAHFGLNLIHFTAFTYPMLA